MRRDVRLLGRLLGDVLRQAGGQDLLDDTERLRRAVIAARRAPGSGDAAAAEIADLVASWPLERAEAVAHAFTVYFHLANLAEEHQRIRTLRQRDTGAQPPRESLAATVAAISEPGPGPGGRPAGGPARAPGPHCPSHRDAPPRGDRGIAADRDAARQHG